MHCQYSDVPVYVTQLNSCKHKMSLMSSGLEIKFPKNFLLFTFFVFHYIQFSPQFFSTHRLLASNLFFNIGDQTIFEIQQGAFARNIPGCPGFSRRNYKL